MEGLGVEPLSVVLVSSGHSVHLLSGQLLPIVVLVLYPPVRGAVIVNLASDDLAVRFLRDGGTYWEQLERVFAREGLCTLSRGG